MATYGAIYGREVGPAQVNAYVHYLADIPVEHLAAALEKAPTVCEFFPTIAALRQLASKQDMALNQLHAERAWDSLVGYIGRWGAELAPVFHGRDAKGAPIFEQPEPLEAAIEWAVRQCGGYEAVANAPTDKTHFIREDFIRHYKRYMETDGQRFPSREEAKQLLGRVATAEQVDRILSGAHTRKRLPPKGE